MDHDGTSTERIGWKHIPAGTECERDGCDRPAGNVHHTLRPSYDDMVTGRDGRQIARRNQRHLLQHLCDTHHHAEGHDLFPDSGKWPAGFGTEEAPFRRNCPEVEAVIAARLEAKASHQLQRTAAPWKPIPR
ncbi:hypothetical protein SR41_16580 [Sphingomonas melonis]|jgi:hypothetical protein|uniref:Uncharacterized protein n=1 Tax=Sphingomonas melonis TaxID=152682 RepID=A0A0D1ME19_9SPHN|nr:hypothetical protein SR41_16580 [Sphingomonas melonis]